MRLRYVVPTMLLIGVLAAFAVYAIVNSDATRVNASTNVSEDVGETTIYVKCDTEVVEEITNHELPEGYKERLQKMLENNPSSEDFVNGYEEFYGTYSLEPLDTTINPVTNSVPLLMQWDTRWGYMVYGSNALGFTGCGPTCMAMVASYLYQDPTYTPAFMAEYAINNGYCVEGAGTAWAFMSEGAEGLGIESIQIEVNEDRMIANLEAGNPIICIMGEGDFTSEGHFIVLAGYEDGKYIINDPNSFERSNYRWTFEEFSDQIDSLWVYRLYE